MEGWPVELGGTWVHWTQPFVWSEIQRYGLEVKETPGFVPDLVVLLGDSGRRELSEAELYEAMQGFELFFEESRTIWERPYDSRLGWSAIQERDPMSVADRAAELELTPLQRDMILSYLESLVHGPVERASYVEISRVWALAGRTFELFGDSLARYKLAKGTASLIQAIIGDSAAEVHLEATVERIAQSEAGVEVTLRGGESLSARAAVVAVPMNVLHDVEFTPALSATKLAASKERHAGVGFKAFVEVEGDPGRVQALVSKRSNPFAVLFTFEQGAERSLLVGFGSDPDVMGARALDTAGWQRAVEEIFPGLRVVRGFGHGWTQDPYAQGTWCTYKPGQVERLQHEMPRSEGRLFFASADSGEGWRGFIDGAIGGGSRAAREAAGMLGAT
jgi:monoamine oxidase